MAFTNDVDILNYALTLEDLEVEMYRKAIASGKLSGKALEYAQTFGAEEQAHADALRATIPKLGGKPVAKRASYNLPDFAAQTQEEILGFLSLIEDTGVGAYLGQVGSIKSLDVLGAAASIYAVEALHTAAIRTLMNREANPNGAFEKALTSDQVLAAAGPLLGPEAGSSAGAGSTPMPAALPRSGGSAVLPLAAAGAAAELAGAALRGSRGRQDVPPPDDAA
ncbi:MAG TPA: ferritin-like domain-containing protein [Chloroflexota bacterium]|nr:ferritin-like domain-containing protein [Chloroflexota bacterium]